MMKLRQVINDAGELYGYRFYCPGCQQEQIIHTGPGGDNVTWAFNGSMEAPTFRPSLQTHWGNENEHNQLIVCHSIITDGSIEFLVDSTHDLAGRTVELPELQEV